MSKGLGFEPTHLSTHYYSDYCTLHFQIEILPWCCYNVMHKLSATYKLIYLWLRWLP